MGSLGHASDASAEGDTPSNASTASAFSESNSPPASPLAALLKMRCEMSGSSYAMFWERSTRGGVPVLTVAGGYVTPARKASLVRMGMSDSYPDACRDVVLDEAGDNMVAKALRSKEAIHIENVSTCPSFVRRDKAARYGIQSITFLATAGGVIEYGTARSCLDVSPIPPSGNEGLARLPKSNPYVGSFHRGSGTVVMTSPAQAAPGLSPTVSSTVTAIIKLLSSVEGKDKVFRLFFFGFKLLRAATQRKMLPLQLLETNLLDARRVFRLFREIETFQALMRQLNLSAADWCIKTCSVAQMIALCGVFVSSHLTLLSKVKLLKFDIGRARWLFGLFFLIATSSGLLQDLRRLLLVQRRLSELAAVSHAGDSSSSGSKQQAERDAKRSEQKETLLAFRNELLCSVMKNGIDHVVALNLMRGATGKVQWNNGIVGFAGTTSSLVAPRDVRSRGCGTNITGLRQQRTDSVVSEWVTCVAVISHVFDGQDLVGATCR